MRHLLSELRRRRVFRVAAGYAAVAFVVAQAADVLHPALLLPDWSYRLIILVLLLGFPIALVLAWAYDLTPEGVRRTGPRDAVSPDPETPDRVTGSPARSVSAAALARGRPANAGRLAAGAGALVLVASAAAFMAGRRAAETPEPDRSIAVLPFRNLSADLENEYFSDGITEDILTQLSAITDVTVVSRTSVMGYKGTTQKLRQIADELGVAYIVEGSVRRVDGRVRVSAQLVDARSDRRTWAEVYDRDLTDIFAIQSDIARRIADALQARLSPGDMQRFEVRPTHDIEAYELYLRGRDQYQRRFGGGNDSAIALYVRAVQQDPDFALAYANLALAYTRRSLHDGWMDSALISAQRALAIDPKLPEAHNAVAVAQLRLGRYREALAALERSVELNSGSAAPLNNRGIVHSELGQIADALEFFHRALALEPVGPARITILNNMARNYAMLRLDSVADYMLERVAKLQPNDPVWYHNRVYMSLVRGDHARAVALSEELEQHRLGADIAIMTADARLFTGEFEAAYQGLATCCGDVSGASHFTREHAVLLALAALKTNRRSEAERLLTEAERRQLTAIEAGHQAASLRYNLAAVYALRQRNVDAVHWLREAIAAGWAEHGLTMRDPLLDNIRQERGFQQVMARLEEELRQMRLRVLQLQGPESPSASAALPRSPIGSSSPPETPPPITASPG